MIEVNKRVSHLPRDRKASSAASLRNSTLVLKRRWEMTRRERCVVTYDWQVALDFTRSTNSQSNVAHSSGLESERRRGG